MKDFLKRLWDGEIFRYLFFGGCTTGVNLAVFSFLRYAGNISVDAANLISILTAVVFAFFVNRRFVFQAAGQGTRRTLAELLNFACMRAGTLAVEFFGVGFLSKYMGIPDFYSKLAVQVLVIVLNYITSKFVVFRNCLHGKGQAYVEQAYVGQAYVEQAYVGQAYTEQTGRRQVGGVADE